MSTKEPPFIELKIMSLLIIISILSRKVVLDLFITKALFFS